ncbi:ABC transporter substrate-binding protein [Labrenzia sp. PHM005]|uniref:substrate-binding periplasmic protein n=1 Tax=Labrenzia sp. PHM005 TaxID=2590016 RepID=UPI00143D6409|nr:transporter substrate-binding domain-containing protein [Labrenzia sp. PHM005]
MRTYKLLLATWFAIITALAGPVSADAWIIASEYDFPPYNYYEDTKYKGIDTEIVRLIVTELGHKPSFAQLPWKRVVKSVESNDVDLGFQFVGTKERFEKFHMVGPFRNGITTLMFPVDKVITFEALNDLKDYVIGTVRGYAYSPEFDNAAFLTKEEATDNETNVRKLAAGRLHAVVGDRDTLAFVAGRLDLVGRFRFADTPLAVVPRYIAFPKQRAEQALAFQKVLNRKLDEGAIDVIIASYTNLKVTQNSRKQDGETAPTQQQ